MKKTEASQPTRNKREEMLPEYELDHGKTRSNRFASLISKNAVTVTLGPDVAEVFRTSGAVDTVLHAPTDP